MSVPFLKKNKGGYSIKFPRSLYPASALLQLKDLYADSDMIVKEKGRYLELSSSSWTAEDCLAVCDSFLYCAKHAVQAK